MRLNEQLDDDQKCIKSILEWFSMLPESTKEDQNGRSIQTNKPHCDEIENIVLYCYLLLLIDFHCCNNAILVSLTVLFSQAERRYNVIVGNDLQIRCLKNLTWRWIAAITVMLDSGKHFRTQYLLSKGSLNWVK